MNAELLARPRPLEIIEVWPIHVTRTAKPELALCGDFVLSHAYPPKAVELGGIRQDGSAIALADVETEAAWLATAPRHPEHGIPGEICPRCMVKIERLRWPRRSLVTKPRASTGSTLEIGTARAHPRRNKRATATARWLENIASEYGDE
jgi:hypothetical protein